MNSAREAIMSIAEAILFVTLKIIFMAQAINSVRRSKFLRDRENRFRHFGVQKSFLIS